MTGSGSIHAKIPIASPAAFAFHASHASAPLSDLRLLRPVYWIVSGIACGIAFRYGGIEGLAVSLAVFIALWAFVEPRPTLINVIAFLIFLFVFFQREAPLGDELPQEFFYWGAGIALITAALSMATTFKRAVNWESARSRLSEWSSIAMFAMSCAIAIAGVNGLILGNQPFAVVRQLFGCVLLPIYYFAALKLFRSSKDVDRWLRTVTWLIALGALWYVQKLSLASLAHGAYFREQSPLTTYAGGAGVIAFAAMLERTAIWTWLEALLQASLCILSIILMGNRAALASLIVACGLLVILRISRRGVIATLIAIIIVTGSVGCLFYYGNQMLERRGIGGEIARRFIVRISDDKSFQGRMAQMEAVMVMVRKSPVLGAGLGSETKFVAPEEGRLRLTSVDNGWGYVMLKMGLLGLVVFVVLLLALLWSCVRDFVCFPAGMLRANTMALLGVLLYATVLFWSGPAFLHFTSASFFGTAFAAMVVLSKSRASERAVELEGRCTP